jgi:hypothetical protein
MPNTLFANLLYLRRSRRKRRAAWCCTGGGNHVEDTPRDDESPTIPARCVAYLRLLCFVLFVRIGRIGWCGVARDRATDARAPGLCA